MKNLFEPAAVAEIKARLGTLTPQSKRKWGKMGPEQAVAHCAGAMEWVVKDSFPPRMLIGRMIGGFIKPKLVNGDEAMRPNSPTVKGLVIGDERDLSVERERLTRLIDRFVAGGHAACTTHPQTFFGATNPDEWAILMYKHLDHHLRQFGV